MNAELNILLLPNPAEAGPDPLPIPSVGHAARVSELKLPLEARDFADEQFRHGFASSYTLRFLPSQLRALRRASGLSQKAFAKKLKTQQSAISRLEKVDNGGLNIHTAVEIGEALDRPFICYWGTYSELLSHVARAERHPEAFLTSPSYAHDPGFHYGKPPLASSENEHLRAVQEILFSWLDAPRPSEEALFRFLAGYDLPPFDDGLPPYELLYRAIQSWGLRGAAEKKFFDGARCAVERLFDLGSSLWDSAASLFHLTSLLPNPDALGRTFLKLFRALENEKHLHGKAPDLDLCSAFTRALFRNQATSELLPLLTRLRTKPHDHPLLYAEPAEIEAAFRLADENASQVLQNPPREIENAAQMIYGMQIDREPREEARPKILRRIRATLDKGNSGDVSVWSGGLLLYLGARNFKWASRTVHLTRDVLKEDLQVPVADFVQFLPAGGNQALFYQQNIL